MHDGVLYLFGRRWVYLPALVISVAWGASLCMAAIANGRGAPSTLATMIAIGAVCGLGTVMLTVLPGFMIYRALKTPPPELPIADGERLLFVAPANHVLRGEARGGHLLVTDARVGFRPHRYNVQLQTWSAPLSSIRALRAVFPTGLRLEMADGSIERLVVPARKQIAAYLLRLRDARPDDRARASRAMCTELSLFAFDQQSRFLV